MQNATLSPFDRLTVLDGLRGFAILLVIWYHLLLVSGYGLPYFGAVEILGRNGFLGVDLFFFVSGFCIFYPYARARREGKPPPGLGVFIRRRALKIAPSYLLAVGVFALLYRDSFDSLGQEIQHVLAHVAFVHVWSHDTFGSLSGPLWTLGVEVQFYALFALLAAQFERRPLTLYAVFVAVAVAYRAAIAFAGLDGDFGWLNQLPGVLDVFGAGMMAALAFVAVTREGNAPKPLVATLCAAGALALAGAGFAAVDAIGHAAGPDGVHRWLNAWRVAFGPVLFVATLGLALGTGFVRRVAGFGFLAWLSVVSYNAYLWNLEIVVGFQRLGLPPWASFWLGGAGTLAVAALVTYGFERPLQRQGSAPRRSRLLRHLSFLLPKRSRAAPRPSGALLATRIPVSTNHK